MTYRHRSNSRFKGSPNTDEPYYYSDSDDGSDELDDDYDSLSHRSVWRTRGMCEDPFGIRGRGPGGYPTFAGVPFILPGGVGGRYSGRMGPDGLLGGRFGGGMHPGRMPPGMMGRSPYSGYGDIPPSMRGRRRGPFPRYNGPEAYGDDGFPPRGWVYRPDQDEEIIFSAMSDGMFEPEYIRRDERGRIVENRRPGERRHRDRRREHDREDDSYEDENSRPGRGGRRGPRSREPPNRDQQNPPQGGLGEPSVGINPGAGQGDPSATNTQAGGQADEAAEPAAGDQRAGQSTSSGVEAPGLGSGFDADSRNGAPVVKNSVGVTVGTRTTND